ncbi:Endoribonuclease L-PSP/chorismate mutase-like protein [Immersiella caudata]|uniref:Endoribonuclease L-PSP/chorismate mutase-like protein n=1 Tax=Immersiella caudata TaxID=314043 RepID=A0AA40C786_9PEZI|nr:Endoribonuclease L-PSP/chorismate mutase-like protein [Immersiella caudata]
MATGSFQKVYVTLRDHAATNISTTVGSPVLSSADSKIVLEGLADLDKQASSFTFVWASNGAREHIIYDTNRGVDVTDRLGAECRTKMIHGLEFNKERRCDQCKAGKCALNGEHIALKLAECGPDGSSELGARCFTESRNYAINLHLNLPTITAWQTLTMASRTLISSGSSFESQIGYSRAVVSGDLIFVSGCTGYDYRTQTISPSVTAQAEQTFLNISTALTAAGSSVSDIVRVRYIMADRNDFSAIWPVLQKWLGDVRPAATMIQAGLMEEVMRVEVEVLARRGGGRGEVETVLI